MLQKKGFCEKHGEFDYIPRTKKSEDLSICPKCLSSQAATDGRRQDLQYQLELRSRVKASGVPEKFVSKTFDEYATPTHEQSKLLKVSKRYVEKFPDIKKAGYGMVLLGDFGTGKTLTASLIAKGVIEQSFRVTYTEHHLMAVQIRDDRRSRMREKETIERYASVDLLIVDELSRHCDEEARTFLNLILAQRYNRCLPTILLGNMVKEDLTRYLTDMVVLRLTENGCYMQLCDWPPMRAPCNESLLH